MNVLTFICGFVLYATFFVGLIILIFLIIKEIKYKRKLKKPPEGLTGLELSGWEIECALQHLNSFPYNLFYTKKDNQEEKK